MESRRDFIKKAALLSGSAMLGSVPESILRAIAIDPALGTSYLDAEHIVILMQENRSFDHSYGSLQGVRGYNDPRVHILPDRKPVWLQTNADGETFAPFRLDIKETNVTWMGSLPHSWGNQVDARNDGHYDKWLLVKPSGYRGYAKAPMTLGHYTREDIPFYYSFADAFTICDQHFCSSLTGTTPNRLYLWTGTIRPEPNSNSKAHVYNEEADFGHEVSWKTFPERLEDAGVSWKIYQNEVSVETGLKGEQDPWLANFGDNPIEYFSQFNVKFCPRHRACLESRALALPTEIEALEGQIRLADMTAERTAEVEEKLAALRPEQNQVAEARIRWSQENYDKLSKREKDLHAKAFTVNQNDPHYRELETLTYRDGDTERKLQVPKGDVLHQFRQDVNSGKLPTVSWIVGPENFSDHPSSAWYGAWYVSEALDILTRNPEVWKKTIFILTYDENDGYFDHVPPFVAPNPAKEDSGKVSPGIDASVEYITLEQDKAFRPNFKPRDSSIGLGYRVPMVVASPWSRGGCVCSQVFDHTSVLQFLEHFLTRKTGKSVREPNISSWRRAVCGDLTSIFQPYNGEATITPPFPKREEFLEGIHRARFKKSPTGFRALSAEEIEAIRRNSATSPHMPKQETGTRKSCPLPYELYADGQMSGGSLHIRFRAGKSAFKGRSAGSPFNAYSYLGSAAMKARAYAASPGSEVSGVWPGGEFEEGRYHVRVDGPNGFIREFRGETAGPAVEVEIGYRAASGAIEASIRNFDGQAHAVEVADLSYGGAVQGRTIPAGASAKIAIEAGSSHGWYDFAIRLDGHPAYLRRAAGRVETGRWSITDPAMGANRHPAPA